MAKRVRMLTEDDFGDVLMLCGVCLHQISPKRIDRATTTDDVQTMSTMWAADRAWCFAVVRVGGK